MPPARYYCARVAREHHHYHHFDFISLQVVGTLFSPCRYGDAAQYVIAAHADCCHITPAGDIA